MKKILVFMLTVAMLLTLCTSALASEEQGNCYQIGDSTVVFAPNSAFSEEEQARIAELLVNPEYGVATANITCTLIGHDFAYEQVTVIDHKVRAQAPRCNEVTYKVGTCTRYRCEETTQELLYTMYITCCSED